MINRETFKAQLDHDIGIVFYLGITDDGPALLTASYDKSTTFENLNEQWEFDRYEAAIPRLIKRQKND